MSSAKHYQQSWVLLNHPEFKMSPGPRPLLKPPPAMVMYSKVAPPRNNAPGYEGAPRTSVVSGFEPGVAHAIHDVQHYFDTYSQGNRPLGTTGNVSSAPHPHGVSGSMPGYTQSGIVPPQTPMTVKVSSMSSTAPDLRTLGSQAQSTRRNEVVEERRGTQAKERVASDSDRFLQPGASNKRARAPVEAFFENPTRKAAKGVPDEHEALIKRLQKRNQG